MPKPNRSLVRPAPITPVTAAPVFDPPGGAYSSSIDVDITCSTPNAVIRYTQDGTDPTSASDVVNAIATVPGMLGSSPATAVFVGQP